jgi:hypothetical protein
VKEEKFGIRDLAYSAWHRAASISRYVGGRHAATLSMVDVDWVLFAECDLLTRQPLALVEVARDVGQAWKDVRALGDLARRADVPAYAALYRTSAIPNPADPRFLDVDRFRVRRVVPYADSDWRVLTPFEWANALVQIRAWSMNRMLRSAANDDQWDRHSI